MIYKRDWMSFFYGGSAYFILSAYAFLSFAVSFFWGMYFVSPASSMLAFFAYQPQVLSIVVPMVTMRLWSEEYRSGTIEKLFTFPVSSLRLVVAKFMAAYSIGAVMLLFSVPLMLTTAYYLPMDFGVLSCSYGGVLMVLLGLTAIGCLASALVSIPVAACILGILLNLLWVNFNFSPMLTSMWQNIPFYFRGVLDFSRNYQNFLNGQLSPVSIFYYASFSGLFLVFNWIVILWRRAK